MGYDKYGYVCTSEVSSELAITEPPGGLVLDEVPAIRREVCLHDGGEVVVVAGVHHRVPKQEHRRHQRLAIDDHAQHCHHHHSKQA